MNKLSTSDEFDGIDLSSKVAALLANHPWWVAEQQLQREESELYVWASESTELEIFDRVYETYEQMSSAIDGAIDKLSLDVVDAMFSDPHQAAAIERDVLGGQPGDGKKPVDSQYEQVTRLAFNRLFADGVYNGDFAACLSMIFTLKDPALAKLFLNLVDRQRPDADYVNRDDHSQHGWHVIFPDRIPTEKIQIALRRHLEAARSFTVGTRLNSASTSLLSKVALRAQLQFPGLSAANALRETIVEPLTVIAGLPPVSKQLLEQAKHLRSIVD